MDRGGEKQRSEGCRAQPSSAELSRGERPSGPRPSRFSVRLASTTRPAAAGGGGGGGGGGSGGDSGSGARVGRAAEGGEGVGVHGTPEPNRRGLCGAMAPNLPPHLAQRPVAACLGSAHGLQTTVHGTRRAGARQSVYVSQSASVSLFAPGPLVSSGRARRQMGGRGMGGHVEGGASHPVHPDEHHGRDYQV